MGSSGGGNAAASDSILWATNEAYARPPMIDPFTQESGIKVELELFSDVTEIASKLKTGGTGISGFVDGSYHAVDSYDAGVLQPIDLANVPNYEKYVLPTFRNAKAHQFDGKVYGIPMDWGTDSVAYNGDSIGSGIDDLAALWDPQFKGQIAMPAGLLEMVIVGGIYAGVDDPFDMSDDELAKVRELLIEQKPLVRTYWKEIGELTSLFASGEVQIAWAWAPVLELREKADIDMVWVVPKQGQLGWYDANFVTSEATPEQKKAFEQFANYVIGDTYGVKLAEEVAYRTTSQAAIDNIPKATQKELDLTDPDAFLNNVNYWIAPKRPKAYEAVQNDVLNA
ncbi:MAG: extracellular solute-binding protein [Thermoleophilia bacterium]|nr:extracellular solute-binding protein [Thermoleophilia bacterium]